jgi:hypothetical protein
MSTFEPVVSLRHTLRSASAASKLHGNLFLWAGFTLIAVLSDRS